MDSDLNYLWKDIEYDTMDQIAGKEYPRTVFFLKWFQFFFHIIEMDNGAFYCGYSNHLEPHRAVYKCNKTFVEEFVLSLFQNSIPMEIQKYNNDIDFRNGPHSAISFWAIECHWNDLHFRFIDDSNHFTYDFTVSAMRIMKNLEEWIRQEHNITPYKRRKSLVKALKGLRLRYFK